MNKTKAGYRDHLSSSCLPLVSDQHGAPVLSHDQWVSCHNTQIIIHHCRHASPHHSCVTHHCPCHHCTLKLDADTARIRSSIDDPWIEHGIIKSWRAAKCKELVTKYFINIWNQHMNILILNEKGLLTNFLCLHHFYVSSRVQWSPLELVLRTQ